MNRLIASVAAVIVLASPVLAQDQPAPKPAAEGGLTYDAAFFFWMPDLSGDLVVGDTLTEADADFSEILDGLKGAGTFHLEVWDRDETGGFFDLNWTSFEKDADFAGGEGEVDASLGFVEIAAATRLKRSAARLDFFIGVRLLRFETELSPPGGGDEEESKSYLDPMIGARVGWDLADWLTLSFRVDVAGFGVGTDLTGKFVFLAGIRVSKSVSLAGGWKSMAIEFEEDTYSVDLLMRGPMLGVNIGY